MLRRLLQSSEELTDYSFLGVMLFDDLNTSSQNPLYNHNSFLVLIPVDRLSEVVRGQSTTGPQLAIQNHNSVVSCKRLSKATTGSVAPRPPKRRAFAAAAARHVSARFLQPAPPVHTARLPMQEEDDDEEAGEEEEEGGDSRLPAQEEKEDEDAEEEENEVGEA